MKKKILEALEIFIEEKHISTKLDPRILSEDDVREFLLKSLSEQRNEIAEFVRSYKIFNPTCGYESDEENGFQKGLRSGEMLMQKEILSFLGNDHKC